MKRNINKKIINNYFTVLLYIFIIFSSMLPNSSNAKKLDSLNTVIPKIDKLYSQSSDDENNEKKEYSFKIIEIIQNFI